MRKLIVGMIAMGPAIIGLAADRMELPGFYGNTWELRRPDYTIWLYLNADGSWDGIFDGKFVNGFQWRTVEGNICVFDPPAEGRTKKEGICFSDRGLELRKVGDAWQLTTVGRDKVWNATIYKGRTVPPTKP